MFGNVYVIFQFVKDLAGEKPGVAEIINKNKHLLLGCISDDITGASDLGLMLASNGLPTTLFLDTPDPHAVVDTPCVVIALKIRTSPVAEAVSEANAAAKWLLNRNARQLFYKYCSTFDSTAKGNIGPVTDALLRMVDQDLTVLLPAFPENGRTVRNGELTVDGVPLSESSMRHHPLTPMTDSYIPRLMDAQTQAGSTSLITQSEVDAGVETIAARLQECRAQGKRYVCIDTASDVDLATIAEAITALRLITGGSGIGQSIPDALRRRQLLDLHQDQPAMPTLRGYAAVLAGSCSSATRTQVAKFKTVAKPIVVDPIALKRSETSKEVLSEIAVAAVQSGDVLVCSTTDPAQLLKIQETMGVEESATLVEETLAYVARKLMDSGIRKFVVAGGETSGAVAKALGIRKLVIGKQIDPGVPWMIADTPDPSCLAFKSGNFGRPDFFQHALDLLP